MDLVNRIKNTFHKRLGENEWMSDSTKKEAFNKLDKMNFKIISPNDGEWRDYSKLELDYKLPLSKNISKINKYEFAFELSQLNNKVDKSLWFMNPHDVNAYYSPNYNEMVFPAGILQGDFFGDDMVNNFGAIGVVIGHELTHGFDDEGRKFDSDGNLRDWWSKEDKIKFDIQASKLEKQFDNLSIEGVKLNGKLTLGENLADLGGIVISYNALEDYVRETREFNDLDKSKFFKSFANIWKSKATPESTKVRVSTDPHAPPMYRVNQILRNFSHFINLYGISETDSDIYLSESDRVNIW